MDEEEEDGVMAALPHGYEGQKDDTVGFTERRRRRRKRKRRRLVHVMEEEESFARCRRLS